MFHAEPGVLRNPVSFALMLCVCPCMTPTDAGQQGRDAAQGSAGGSMGPVSAYLPFWGRICSAGSYVPGWLSSGFPLKWMNGHATPSYASNSPSAKKEAVFVSNSITELLQAGAVREVGRQPQVVSPLSVVPKKNGKLRLKLDLRHVNDFLDVPSFKFERLLDVEYISDVGERLLASAYAPRRFRVPGIRVGE